MTVCIEMEREDIREFIPLSQSINVYMDGAQKTYSANDSEFENIVFCWSSMVDCAHPMPAFGVSLNGKTTEAMKEGVWLEFVFGKQYECSGMPFDKLLIEVNAGFQGFNIIRYTQDYGYDGRCYYIDLVGKNMLNLYNLLANI